MKDNKIILNDFGILIYDFELDKISNVNKFRNYHYLSPELK